MSIEDPRVSMFRALGDRTRLSIFEFLSSRRFPVAVGDRGEVRRIEGATVGEVCCHMTGSDKFNSTISHHLRELRLAGLISAERDGKFMICSVNREAVERLTEYVHDLSRANAYDCSPALVGDK
ncbi:MAG: hypothetical protein HONBIEJF_01773 [Fimbriimonadaceae bacterium]|nr:hypothetical protein [Fimbriimonadaceae bacterium]